MEGYYVKALTDQGIEKVVFVTTSATEAARKADDLRREGYEAVNIERYK